MYALVYEHGDVVDAALDAEDSNRAEMRHRVEHDEERAREYGWHDERYRDFARNREQASA